jgi:hypothetical protein
MRYAFDADAQAGMAAFAERLRTHNLAPEATLPVVV